MLLAQYSDGGGSEFLTIYLVTIVILGFVCSAIWSGKGGSGTAGFFLGFILGILGLIIAAVGTPTGSVKQKEAITRECPHCKERMRRDASVCPHCQRDSIPWVRHEGVWWVTNSNGSRYYLDERRNAWVETKPVRPKSPSLAIPPPPPPPERA